MEKGYYADGEDAYDMRHSFVHPPNDDTASVTSAMKDLSVSKTSEDDPPSEAAQGT